MTRFFGRPYPIQFRAQGALDAWTHALGNIGLWRVWQDPGTLCWQVRQEILRQLECTHPLSPVVGQITAEDRQRRLAFQVSTNLKYHLSEETVIEATAALETLLANSDVDLSLPMSMVAPPYRAQYLRFGEAAMRYLKVPAPQAADHFFEKMLDAGTRLHQQAPGQLWWPCLAAPRNGSRGHHGRRVVGRGSRRRHGLFVAPALGI